MNNLKNYVNWKLTHADKTDEAEGYPLVLENCKANKKMKQLEIYGNSFQDGTPTPENPIEVQSVGERTINLFDKDNLVRANAWNLGIIKSTETGVLITPSIEGNGENGINTIGFFCASLGLASQYAGKTLTLTSTVSYSSNTLLIIMLTDGSAAVSGSKFTLKDGLYYSTLTIPDEAYTDELVCVRLYFNVPNGTIIDYKNIMVAETATPLPYEPYGKYKIPVVQRGKNFLNPSVVSAMEIRSNLNPTTKNTSGTTIDSTDLSDNKITITQVSNSDYQASTYRNGYFCVRTDDLIAGNRYKLSFDVDIVDNPLNASSIQVLSGGNHDATGTAYFTNEKQRVSCTFKHKLPSHQYAYPYLEIRCMGMSFTASNFMITETDFDDGFEPYIEPTTTNIFLDEPLRKIGDYADYVDFKENKVVRNIKQRVLDGVSVGRKIYSVTQYSNGLYYALCSEQTGIRNGADVLKNTHFNASNNLAKGQCYMTSGATACRMVHSNQELNTASLWNEWLKEQYDNDTPVTFDYILATPTEEPITCELPKLTSKITIIEVDTSLMPSNMYGKYIKR